MSSSTVSPQVLVVGAGPTGLLLALSLVQNGVTVRVIEKDIDPQIGIRGAGVVPRTLETFSLLGVLPDVLKQSDIIHPFRMYELPGGVKLLKTWNLIEHREATPAIPYPDTLMLGQDKNVAILRDHLKQHGVEVENGTELVSLQQNDETVVSQVKRFGREQLETIESKYLVGADGGRGITRKLLGLTFRGESRVNERFILGDIYIDGLDKNYWHLWGSPETATVSFAGADKDHPDKLAFLIYGAQCPYSDLAAGGEGAIIEYIKKHTGRQDLTYKSIPWYSDYKPNFRVASKFHEDRVFLAGDSCHVHSLTGAQGMNSGVLDAMNLSWKLALACKGLAAPGLLETYGSERLPVITEMLDKTTKLLDRTFTASSDESWRRGEHLRLLGVNYRWSSIVVDENAAGDKTENQVDAYGMKKDGLLCAGDRAPDAPGLVDAKTGACTSLFEQFKGTHHTALLFLASGDGPRAEGLLKFLHNYPAGLIHSLVVLRGTDESSDVDFMCLTVADKDGYAFEAYASAIAGGASIVIVRPDGYIGAVVRDEPGVEKYFRSVITV